MFFLEFWVIFFSFRWKTSFSGSLGGLRSLVASVVTAERRRSFIDMSFVRFGCVEVLTRVLVLHKDVCVAF